MEIKKAFEKERWYDKIYVIEYKKGEIKHEYDT